MIKIPASHIEGEAVSTAKHFRPDLFESGAPIGSTFVRGNLRSPLDLLGPGFLNVVLMILQARQQLGRQSGSVLGFESQGFLEDLPCRFCHPQMVSTPAGDDHAS